MRFLIAVAALSLPGYASARQGASSTVTPQDRPSVEKPRQGSKEVRGNTDRIRALDAAHARAVDDLDKKENASVDAIRNEKSLSREEKQQKIAEIGKDFKDLRKTLDDKYRSDKKTLLIVPENKKR